MSDMAAQGIVMHDFGGQGPTLLLLHANGFHGHIFQPMVPDLKQHFHVVAFDLLGHGSAAPLPPLHSMQEFADLVSNRIQELGLSGCYVFGHSLGGTLALLTELKRPGTFRAIYVYEPVLRSVLQSQAGIGPPGEVSEDVRQNSTLVKGARRRRARFASREEAARTLGAKPPFSHFHHDAFQAYLDYGLRPDTAGGVQLCCRPEQEAAIYVLATPAPCPDLSVLSAPTGIATGYASEDPGSFNWLAFIAVDLAKNVPSQRLDRYQLSHLAPMEDPKAVAAGILEFFRQILRLNTMPSPKL